MHLVPCPIQMALCDPNTMGVQCSMVARWKKYVGHSKKEIHVWNDSTLVLLIIRKMHRPAHVSTVFWPSIFHHLQLNIVMVGAVPAHVRPS